MARSKTLQKAIQKADKYFSQYIRQSRAVDGYCTCVTCETRKRWNEIDAGHYHHRGFYGTRWDEKNVNPQCRHCNSFQGGMPGEYGTYMRKKYSEKALDELHALAHNAHFCMALGYFKLWDYVEDIAEKYREKLKEIK